MIVTEVVRLELRLTHGDVPPVVPLAVDVPPAQVRPGSQTGPVVDWRVAVSPQHTVRH